MTWLLSESELRVILRAGSVPAVDPVIAAILDEVERAGGPPRAYILGHSRRPQLVAARHAVMWAAARAGLSASEIGRSLRRHHTTVLWVLRKEVR